MLLEAIRKNSAALGPRAALRCGAEVVTWGELWPWAESLAARLRARGTGPVAVCGDREAWMGAAFVACLIAGRPYLPLSNDLPPLRRSALLRESGAEELTRAAAYEGFLAGAHCTPAEGTTRPAYVLFTSGSTGRPKRVEISLGNLEHFLAWASTLPGAAAAGGTALGQAAFSFDLSVSDLYLALLLGGTHVSLTGEELGEAGALLARLKESGATFLSATPSFLRLCLGWAEFSRENLPGLSTVFSCGEALPVRTAKKLLERFPGLTLLNAYGPTEATCAVTAAVITPERCAGERLPIGERGRCAVEVTLEDGEIVLRGESVAESCGGAYHTGDLGEEENGLLYWCGRKDEQIKYKGYRIEPAEIEAALEQAEGVDCAAVVPRISARGEVLGLTAFWEGAAAEETVRAAALARLNGYQVPAQWRPLPALPRNANGKVDKKALKEMLR